MESVLDFLLNNIELITAWVLSIGAVSALLLKAKKIIKELAEALITLSDALEDDTLTKEEVANIIKEFSDIIAIFKKKEVAK